MRQYRTLSFRDAVASSWGDPHTQTHTHARVRRVHFDVHFLFFFFVSLFYPAVPKLSKEAKERETRSKRSAGAVDVVAISFFERNNIYNSFLCSYFLVTMQQEQ